MKKIIFGLLLTAGLVACSDSNSNTTKSEADSKAAPVTPGIENVNGNLPDTTNTVRLNSTLPKDSSNLRDSTQH